MFDKKNTETKYKIKFQEVFIMFELMPFGSNHNFRNSDRDMFSLMDAFDKDFFRGGFDHALAGFKTDIIDNGDSFLIESELPGFSKENIQIDVNGDFLTIRAKSSLDKKEEEKKNFVHRERRYSSYERSFNIDGIDSDNVSAEYSDGILKITLPKIKEKELPKKSIEIK